MEKLTFNKLREKVRSMLRPRECITFNKIEADLNISHYMAKKIMDDLEKSGDARRALLVKGAPKRWPRRFYGWYLPASILLAFFTSCATLPVIPILGMVNFGTVRVEPSMQFWGKYGTDGQGDLGTGGLGDKGISPAAEAAKAEQGDIESIIRKEIESATPAISPIIWSSTDDGNNLVPLLDQNSVENMIRNEILR